MSAERWFPVVGWEFEYLVSTELRVQSMRRRIIRSNNVPITIPGRYLTPVLVDGHPTVFLTRNRIQEHRCIAALLREAQEANR
jgi:hypothetical protein